MSDSENNPPALPPEMWMNIGFYCSVSEVSKFRRVNKRIDFAFGKASQMRKSVSLLPFMNHGFHTFDSTIASLLRITRDDMIGMSFYNLYNAAPDGCVEENKNNIRQFFKSHPQIENLEIHSLTEFMLDSISQSGKIRRLAFHYLGNGMNGKMLGEKLANLNMVAFGSQISDAFIRDSLASLKKLNILGFFGPIADSIEYYDETVDQIDFEIITAATSELKEVYFGTRRVITDGIKMENVSKVENITLLEILNPDPHHLNQFIKNVLPVFQKLQSLTLGLCDTESSLFSGSELDDDGDEAARTISLIPSLPDLCHLTLTLTRSFLPFADVFGTREKLQTLRISGAVIESRKCSTTFVACFDVDQVEEFVTHAPNLKYWCVVPWLYACELNPHLIMRYVKQICRLNKLRILHLPHTVIDVEVIEVLAEHLPDLRRIEFIGRVRDDEVTRTMHKRIDLKWRFNIVYQNDVPYCTCPYSQTNCRIISKRP
jgi:hypothetical protein